MGVKAEYEGVRVDCDRLHCFLDGRLARGYIGWIVPGYNGIAQIGLACRHPRKPGANVQAAGASWIAERAARDRFLVSFQESVFGGSINTGGDADLLDSSPTFPRFDPADVNDLDFPGPAVAVNAANPGIEMANNVGFYRVDEAADNRDWNGDNVKNDQVLFRTSLSNNFSKFVGVLNNLPGSSIAGGSTPSAPPSSSTRRSPTSTSTATARSRASPSAGCESASTVPGRTATDPGTSPAAVRRSPNRLEFVLAP